MRGREESKILSGQAFTLAEVLITLGIIGIVAGKICEEYKKPCIILTSNDDGKTVVGSARSTEHLNIYETLKKFMGEQND